MVSALAASQHASRGLADTRQTANDKQGSHQPPLAHFLTPQSLAFPASLDKPSPTPTWKPSCSVGFLHQPPVTHSCFLGFPHLPWPDLQPPAAAPHPHEDRGWWGQSWCLWSMSQIPGGWAGGTASQKHSLHTDSPQDLVGRSQALSLRTAVTTTRL